MKREGMKCGRYIALFVTVIGMVGCEKESGTNTTTAPPLETIQPATGFVDYDWLPEKLKHTMDHLTHLYPEHIYRFYYYFTTDDINRHYYMIDPGLDIIEEMPVTNENALSRIDEQLYNVKTRKRGIYVAQDTVDRRQEAKTGDLLPEHKIFVFYVLPENSADFSQLRVAIVKDTSSQRSTRYFTSNDLTVYDISKVDTPPRPVRGINYFIEAVTKAVQSAEIFTLYDTGAVEVEFTVWHSANSPNIICGFSSQDSTYEAYQADGEVLKAIHHAKVWWYPARKDGQPVRSKMRVTFDVSTLKN